jgi:hypothetical protein
MGRCGVPKSWLVLMSFALMLSACAAGQSAERPELSPEGVQYRDQPLVRELFFADPAAHLFNGRIYIYGSHDIEGPAADDQPGRGFVMRDYRVLSMDRIGGPVTVHPVAMTLEDVPWASRQLWAPDAAAKNGRYYLYFPAKDREGIFRIGVASGDRPEGPFRPEPEPIAGSYSIDPAVFIDTDGQSYLYFGGIHGGQLQRWTSGGFDRNGSITDLAQPDAPALMPRMARLRDDMRQFAEPVRDVVIVDDAGQPLLGGDTARRFFEAPWIHKLGSTYYLSYSTGDTHFIAYATSSSPYGPFVYRGQVLKPVQGWTTHHSVVNVRAEWWLFYHDSQLSNRTHLRSPKVTRLEHLPDGSIRTIDPFVRVKPGDIPVLRLHVQEILR